MLVAARLGKPAQRRILAICGMPAPSLGYGDVILRWTSILCVMLSILGKSPLPSKFRMEPCRPSAQWKDWTNCCSTRSGRKSIIQHPCRMTSVSPFFHRGPLSGHECDRKETWKPAVQVLVTTSIFLPSKIRGTSSEDCPQHLPIGSSGLKTRCGYHGQTETNEITDAGVPKVRRTKCPIVPPR